LKWKQALEKHWNYLNILQFCFQLYIGFI
jgi:hypothetical protein